VPAAGESIVEPVVKRGPFVVNLHEEITQAMDDRQSGCIGRLNDRGNQN